MALEGPGRGLCCVFGNELSRDFLMVELQKPLDKV